MFYDNDNYEVTTSTEVENFLAELPFDLLKASIVDQIKDPVSTNINYVEIILEKCNIYREQYDDEETIARIDNALIEFFTFVVDNINTRFDLGIDVDDMASTRDIIEFGEVLYEYFIIRYVKNISKFITTYIMKHKKELTAYYSDKNKKDVTSLTFKKQLKDNHDLTIIVNLPSIINYIISLDIDPLEFVSLSAGQNNCNALVIKGLIIANRMVGNFVRSYIDLSVDEHDYLIDEIQTDIRVRIIKKLT